MNKLKAIGDVHADLGRLRLCMINEDVIHKEGHWCGGDTTFVFIGDLVDRGPFTVSTVKFVMRLEAEAAEAGGKIISLMGNHEPMLLSLANTFISDERVDPHLFAICIENGAELQAAKEIADDEKVMEWLKSRPLVYREQGVLFQHADSTVYYSSLVEGTPTVDSVNAAGREKMLSPAGTWNIFWEMTDRRWWDNNVDFGDKDVEDIIGKYMAHMEAHTIVHGHTRHNKRVPKTMRKGTLVNIDGSLSVAYNRNPYRGFIWEYVPPVEEATTL